MPKYQRILLKLSGEALNGDITGNIDPKIIDRMAREIGDLTKLKIQIGIVVGGGNFFRGEALSQVGIGRITGDQIGMLATLINALALRDALERAGIAARVMSAIPMSGVVDHYDRRKAIYHLEIGCEVVIFAAGTGNPLVTTDSAASLRAIEINADVLLKATNVDGIYDKDPKKFPDATMYQQLTYRDALQKELGVMDLGAFCQCRDHKMPIQVFNLHKPGALQRVVMGQSEGTKVC